jgi:hypothetical protein
VRVTSDAVHAHGQFLSAMAFTIAKFCAQQPLATDPHVIAALRAQAETYKSLVSGIVYEQPPAGHVQRELYETLSAFSNDARRTGAPSSFGPIRDSEIFQLLVFLFRMGLLRSNDRPRSRRFIEFLRGQFPGAQELQREQSRIIVP